jgi:hypothetical protein
MDVNPISLRQIMLAMLRTVPAVMFAAAWFLGVVIFSLALTYFTPAAHAGDLVARQGDDSVRLHDTACTSAAVLARLDADQVREFRAADARFQGQDFVACWRLMGNVAFLVYEDGDQGVIPVQELKPALGA